MQIKEGLSFDDVLLVPQHGVLDRRADADISTELVSGLTLYTPIISSNMPSVTGHEMAIEMVRNGGYGALHRFNTIEEQVQEYNLVKDSYADAACAVGLDDWDRIASLAEVDCKIFILDVAHGDCDRVLKMVEVWKSLRDSAKLIVGNVATYDAAYKLAYYEVDAIKVGIGPGAACTTREVTGFGVPQLTAIKDVRSAIDTFFVGENGFQTKLIADGGIKSSGDIVKALAAGADSVMIGRLLAGTNEAPHGAVYYGNASHHVNGHHAPEGVYSHIEEVGPVKDVLKKLSWGIKSGVSYGGGHNLKELRENAEFIKVSPLTALESAARI